MLTKQVNCMQTHYFCSSITEYRILFLRMQHIDFTTSNCSSKVHTTVFNQILHVLIHVLFIQLLSFSGFDNSLFKRTPLGQTAVLSLQRRICNCLSDTSGLSLFLCFVRMIFCCENTLSQLAVCRGRMTAICPSLMISPNSSR